MILLLEPHAPQRKGQLSTFEMLESLGFEVTQVTDPEACCAYFDNQSQWPELILMDYDLAEKSVYQAAVSIKTLENAQTLPIIFLLDNPDMSTISQCLLVGDDYLKKPFTLSELLARVHVHQKMRQLNRQLEWQNKKLRHARQLIHSEHDIVGNIFTNYFENQLLNCPTIRYHISPMSVFHGDVLLTAQGPSGNIYIALGDVTGHGLPAAVGSIPAYQSFRTTAQKGMPVGTIAEEMNKAVFQLLPDNMLMALTLIEFNPEANLVSIWSGGMPPLFWTDSEGRLKQLIRSQHGPLAMLGEGEFSTDINVIRVESGDRLYLMTDGVEECRNPQRELFGEARLLQLFEQGHSDTFTHIIEQLDAFKGDSASDDDLTMLELVCAPCELVTPLAYSWPQSPRLPWQVEIQLDAEQLRSINVIPLVSKMLSNASGIDIHQDFISTILSELFSNALEHGLLQLDSDMKHDEAGFLEYYSLRKKRLSELQQGQITLRVQLRPDSEGADVEIELKDSGNGFDYQHKAQSGELAGFGHGINLVNTLCDSVAYSEGGSRVKAVYRIQRDTT